MSMGQPPMWPMPQDAVPGAAPPYGLGPPGPPADRRLISLGTTCVVLAVLEIIWCVLKALYTVAQTAQFAKSSAPPSMPGMPDMSKVTEAAEDFTREMVLWESVRMLPFLVASIALIVVGNRLRAGRREALRSAQTWVVGALAAILASAALQLLVIIPATMAYSRKIMDLMLSGVPGGAGATPVDFKGVMSTMTAVTSYLGVLLGAAFLALWPVVLWFWAVRIQRDAAPPQAY